MFFKDKKVLVTGSQGLVGSHLVEALVNQGAKVRGTWHNAFRDDYATASVEYVKADLLNPDECKKVCKDQDFVFMCSANTSGAATMAKTPLVHVTPNIIMNAQMLEAAYFGKVNKVLWLSSTTGYPDKGEIFTREEEMFDGDPHDKYFAVGWMKRYTEVLCRLYSEKLVEKMPVVVLRPTNITGPRDKFDPQRSHVLPALIRKVVERQKPLEVWGDGTEVRDFVYVTDMVDAMLLAMEKINGYNPINIGMGKTYTVNEILQMIIQADAFEDAEVVYNKTAPTMIPKRIVDVSKAKKLLGWEAKVGIEELIKRTINWYVNQRTCVTYCCCH